MRDVHATVAIEAPPERVWDALADLTAMRDYMPGLKTVELTSEAARGVGAGRHCVFEDGVALTERVTAWDEGQGYTLETVAFSGVPMRSNVITFTLGREGGTTTVTQGMRYAMKGGPLAPLMEWMARGMMRKALRGSLDGLKRHVEA